MGNGRYRHLYASFLGTPSTPLLYRRLCASCLSTQGYRQDDVRPCDGTIGPHRPISIDAETREDKEHSALLEQRGFELKTREHTSNLDLAAFDPEKWAATLNYVADSNIEIKSLTEL